MKLGGCRPRPLGSLNQDTVRQLRASELDKRGSMLEPTRAQRVSRVFDSVGINAGHNHIGAQGVLQQGGGRYHRDRPRGSMQTADRRRRLRRLTMKLIRQRIRVPGHGPLRPSRRLGSSVGSNLCVCAFACGRRVLGKQAPES